MGKEPVFEPEQLSSLCFMDAEASARLKKMLWDIEQICLRFTVPMDIASHQESLTRGRLQERLLRRALGADEQNGKSELKKIFDESNVLLQNKWENCASGSDCLLELIVKQREVNDFLQDAAAKTKGTFTAKHIASSKTPKALAELNELEKTMRHFTNMPFQTLQEELRQKMETQAPVLTELASTDYLGNDGKDMLRLQTAQANCMRTLSDMETKLKDAVYNIDDMGSRLDMDGKGNRLEQRIQAGGSRGA